MSEKVFHTRQDVLDHHQVPDEQRLDRLIYNATECGAWARFERGFVRTGVREVMYTALLQRSLAAVYVHTIVEGQTHAELTPDSPEGFPGVPYEAKEYLLLPEDGRVSNLTVQEFESLKTEGTQTVRRVGPRAIVTFAVELVDGEDLDGLVVGSTAEGSDGTVERWLPFPFTEADLERVVSEVEVEADAVWREAQEPLAREYENRVKNDANRSGG